MLIIAYQQFESLKGMTPTLQSKILRGNKYINDNIKFVIVIIILKYM